MRPVRFKFALREWPCATSFSLAGLAIRAIPGAVNSPQVESVRVNGGEAQRSSVTSVEVTFDSLVDVPDSAFSLMNLGITTDSSNMVVTGLQIDSNDVGSKTVTTITFGSGTSVIDRVTTNTLDDGNYQLDIIGSLVQARGGGPSMTNDYRFGADTLDNFFRHYGDGNGDGITDFNDFASSFLPSFGVSLGSQAYRDEMDANGDGFVDFDDFRLGFLPNFGTGR